MKTVQTAIEMTTAAQEAKSQQVADALEQEARGKLERQKINDQSQAEDARIRLKELQAKVRAVETTGQARAEAQSRADAARIEGQARVQQTKLVSQAKKIELDCDMELLVSSSHNACLLFLFFFVVFGLNLHICVCVFFCFF